MKNLYSLYIHASHLLFKSEHGSSNTCSCLSAHDTSGVHSFFRGSGLTCASIQTLLLLIPVQENAAFANSAASNASPNENTHHTTVIKI